VQAVGGGLSGLAAQFSDESALEVCIHVMRYTNRHIYFTFSFYTRFRLVPKSTTLDDFEGPLRILFQNTCVFCRPPGKFE